LDAESQENFEKDGYIICKNVIPTDAIEAAIKVCQDIVDAIAQQLLQV
jgi:hypothetical protein